MLFEVTTLNACYICCHGEQNRKIVCQTKTCIHTVRLFILQAPSVLYILCSIQLLCPQAVIHRIMHVYLELQPLLKIPGSW